MPTGKLILQTPALIEEVDVDLEAVPIFDCQ